jgi:ABC-type polysaccharide/polyol phosphate export permease
MYFAFEEYDKLLMLFFHNLLVFYIFMIIMGTFAVPHYTFIFGFILDVISLITWSTIIGMFSARYRDLRFLLPSLSFLLFMLTPVYWDISMLSEDRRWIADLNPLNGMLSVLREPLLGRAASAVNWTSAGLVAFFGVVAWLIFFPAFRRRIPFWV